MSFQSIINSNLFKSAFEKNFKFDDGKFIKNNHQNLDGYRSFHIQRFSHDELSANSTYAMFLNCYFFYSFSDGFLGILKSPSPNHNVEIFIHLDYENQISAIGSNPIDISHHLSEIALSSSSPDNFIQEMQGYFPLGSDPDFGKISSVLMAYGHEDY